MVASTSNGESFTVRLKHLIQNQDSHLCLGIDPPLPSQAVEQFGALSRSSDFLQKFGMTLLRSTDVRLVKFQSAYFEAYGQAGMQALADLCVEAKTLGYFVILDAKRGDISTTMTAYGHAAFEVFGADALTVNAYMGSEVLDALTPWLQAGKGAYVVWVTSNPSAGGVQEWPNRMLDVKSSGELPDDRNSGEHLSSGESYAAANFAEHLFSYLNRYAESRGIQDAIGYVLGATKMATLSERLLEQVKLSSLLLPGVGAQGAPVDEKMKRVLREGRASVVPVSRGISYRRDHSWNSWQEFGQHATTQSATFQRLLCSSS